MALRRSRLLVLSADPKSAHTIEHASALLVFFYLCAAHAKSTHTMEHASAFLGALLCSGAARGGLLLPAASALVRGLVSPLDYVFEIFRQLVRCHYWRVVGDLGDVQRVLRDQA